MENKGFTLIELLAVLVILAVILLIVFPIVTTTITKSRKSAAIQSLGIYTNTISKNLIEKNLDDEEYILNGAYNIKNGDLCLSLSCSEILEVNAKNKPTEGILYFNNGELTKYKNVKFKEYYLSNDGNKTEFTKSPEILCEKLDGSNGNIQVGDKYKCKVDPNKDAYIFYVLTPPDTELGKVSLIMDSNINLSGDSIKTKISGPYPAGKKHISWIEYSDFIQAGGSEEDFNNNININKYGPVTAMKNLANATEDWTNIEDQIINKFTDENNNKYNMTEVKSKARLPYYQEVSSNLNSYLYEYLSEYGQPGYWLLSSGPNSNDVWIVSDSGLSLYSIFQHSYGSGIRPVITVSIFELSK